MTLIQNFEKLKTLWKVFSAIPLDKIDNGTLEQFIKCTEDDSFIKWAIQADAHEWYTLCIWWVIINKNKIFPSYVGYDIWCGMCSIKTDLKIEDIKWKEDFIFDEIYKQIPCWEWKWWTFNWEINLPLTGFWKTIWESNKNQIWTLWGWNHFIEIWYDEENNIWVTIHSWSRWFWYKIADYYTKLAKKENLNTTEFEKEFEKQNEKVKQYNPEKYWEILNIAINKYITKELKWEASWNNWFDINSKDWKDYIMDMNFWLEFALLNRKTMINKVLEIIWWKELLFINKNHNCADFLGDWLVRHRKGATSADFWELWVIPWNMKDWTVIVKWKWNPDFLNCSSHWAWRILWRNQAKKQIDLKDFKNDMTWIKAKVEEDTKDESRFAYKNFQEVLYLQKESIEILNYIKPIINIKW